MLKNEKGLTLIELLMALSLTGLIVMLAVQVYMTQSSSFKVSQEKAKLISEAQYIQERLTTIGLQSQGIEEIAIEGVSLLGQVSSEKDITLLQFKTSDEADRIFNYDLATQQLFFGTELLSDQVESWKVKVLGGSHISYQQAHSIEIELNLKSTRLRFPVEHNTTISITFRNK